MKKEVLDRTTRMWRNRLGRGFGPAIRENTELMNTIFNLPFSEFYRRNEFYFEDHYYTVGGKMIDLLF